MILVLFGLIIAAFIALPLYLGFWPVTIVAAIVATLIAGVYIYMGNDRGEDGLVNIVMGTLAVGSIWLAIGIAGIIEWIR